MVEDDGEDEEIIVGRPRPRSPMRQVAVDEQEYSQHAFDVEVVADHIPFLGQEIFGLLGEEGGNLVLVESVVKFLFFTHASDVQR